MRRVTAIGLLVIAVLLLAISSGGAGPFDVLKDKIPTKAVRRECSSLVGP